MDQHQIKEIVKAAKIEIGANGMFTISSMMGSGGMIMLVMRMDSHQGVTYSAASILAGFGLVIQIALLIVYRLRWRKYKQMKNVMKKEKENEDETTSKNREMETELKMLANAESKNGRMENQTHGATKAIRRLSYAAMILTALLMIIHVFVMILAPHMPPEGPANEDEVLYLNSTVQYSQV